MSQHFIELVRRGATTEIAEAVQQDAAIAESRDAQGVSALMWTVYTGQHTIREFLLSGLASLDVFEAAATGDAARLNALLSANPALAHARSADGWTALHLAAAFGGPEPTAILLSHGADVLAVSRNAMQNQPLHAAVSLSRQQETIALLLQHGARVNAKQMGGYTPLHQAASSGQLALVEQLLAAGADPFARCDREKTPADYAEEKSYAQIAAKLTKTAP